MTDILIHHFTAGAPVGGDLLDRELGVNDATHDVYIGDGVATYLIGGPSLGGVFLSIDGSNADQNIDIGDFTFTAQVLTDGTLTIAGGNLTTGGIISSPRIENSAGELKIQPDSQGDVVLFDGDDVGNDNPSKKFTVYRRAAEGDNYFRIYISSSRVVQFDAYGIVFFNSSSDLHLQPKASGDLTIFLDSGSGENRFFRQAGYITDGANEVEVSWQVDDTDDFYWLRRENTKILGLTIDMPMRVGDLTGGSNYSAFAANGELALHGTAKVYRHIRVSAASWKLGSTAPTEGFTGIFPHLSFANNADDAAHYTLIVPHRWDGTSDMTLRLFWYYTGGNDNTTCEWNLTYNAIAVGEDPTGAGTAHAEVATAIATDDTVGTTDFTIPAAALVAHDHLGLKIWRDGSDALSTAAILLDTHFEFVMDKIGESTV